MPQPLGHAPRNAPILGMLMSDRPSFRRIDRAHEQALRREYAPAVSQDVKLELARRIDWRFLLPDPRLGSVACIGCRDNLLRDALLLFCEAVVFFDKVEDNLAPTARFDLVVVCGSSLQEVAGAAALVRPGGYLFVEVQRSWRLPTSWTLLPTRMKTVLNKLGMQEIHVHWHWPNFNDCRTVLPIDDGGASASFFFSQQGTSLLQQCKSAAGQILLSTGVLNGVVTSYSVLGERPAP